MVPCYARPENDWARTAFFVIVIIIAVGFALAWVLIYSTQEELINFGPDLALGFLLLGIGFFFYASNYPEKIFKKSRFVQIWIPSHFWWHILISAMGYS